MPTTNPLTLAALTHKPPQHSPNREAAVKMQFNLAFNVLYMYDKFSVIMGYICLESTKIERGAEKTR